MMYREGNPTWEKLASVYVSSIFSPIELIFFGMHPSVYIYILMRMHPSIYRHAYIRKGVEINFAILMCYILYILE